MENNNNLIPIPGRLHDVSTNGVISGADEIFDDAKGKRQSVINQETDAALENKYDKDETYSKQELNNLITTPNQDYVTVPTYGSLPATGETDTVYRVSNYDGEQSQVDATKYSEYAWDGTQYVFLCVKSQIGEVFDITAYNSNTKYADLAAALGTNGSNVPDTVRKGGMSVKFVCSSDNKYIRFNLLAQSFTTDTTQWAIDDVGVYVESPEYVEVKTDLEGKILEGIKTDGKKEISLPTTLKDDVIINGDLRVDGDIINDSVQAQIDVAVSDMQQTIANNFTNIDNIVNNPANTTPHGYLLEQSNPEWLQVTIDSDEKVLGGRRVDGTVVENIGIEAKRVSAEVANIEEATIETLNLSEDGIEKLRDDLETEGKTKVFCVGDSITQGQDGIISPSDDRIQENSYEETLASILGNDYNVINLGVGGQNPGEIFSRMGWIDLILTEDLTLPSDTTKVAVPSLIDSCQRLATNYIMQQGTIAAREQMKYCYINGIECELSYENSALYIKRKESASQRTTFLSGSHLTFKGSKGDGIYLIYAGQNGTYVQDAALFAKTVRTSISNIEKGKYLILGLFTSIEGSKTQFEAANLALEKEFGCRFIYPDYMWSQQAFDDLNYTPTTYSDITTERYNAGVRSDEYQMERGLLPSSFWRFSYTDNQVSQGIDRVHLNSLGYASMARAFYHKMKSLNWI